MEMQDRGIIAHCKAIYPARLGDLAHRVGLQVWLLSVQDRRLRSSTVGPTAVTTIAESTEEECWLPNIIRYYRDGSSERRPISF